MSDTIKGFRGKDGPILLDYSGVANVPGAIQSIGALTAQPGDHFEVETVDSTGKVATVKAVEKPGGGSGQNVAQVEPAYGDRPLVFFGAPLQQTKDEIVCEIWYYSKTLRFHGWAKIKGQGHSTMMWPKKNQTVKLYKDPACTEKLKIDFKGWGKQHKFVIKSYWRDLTHTRDIASVRLESECAKSRDGYSTMPELLRTSPNMGAVDGFPVVVYANGIYQGRYMWNIPKDAWMANMDDERYDHCILCSEDYNSGCFRAAAKIDGTDWTDEIHDSVPVAIKTRWNEIISFVQNATDKEFEANMDSHIDVESLIDRDLMGLYSCDFDGYGKNQVYITYDGKKWYADPYDKDGTWGNYWNGNAMLPSNYGRNQYEDMISGRPGNLLFIRMQRIFWKRYQDRWAILGATTLSVANTVATMRELSDITPPYVVAEDYAPTTAGGAFTSIPNKDICTIQQMQQFAAERHEWMDAYIASLGPGEQIPCTGISLDKSTLTFTAEGTQTLTATVTPDGCTDIVVWESSEIDIATVENGVVSPVKNGNVTITAKCGEYTASCSVLVSVPGFADHVPCTGITLSQNNLTFDSRMPQTLIASVTPENTTDVVEWESSDTAVVTVSNGLVEAVFDGDAIVKAVCGEHNAECVVSVNGLGANIMPDDAPYYGMLNTNTGSVITSTDYVLTDYFDVVACANKRAYFNAENADSSDALWRICFYDADKVFLGSLAEGDDYGIRRIPEKAAYARVSCGVACSRFSMYEITDESNALAGAEVIDGYRHSQETGELTLTGGYATQKIDVIGGETLYMFSIASGAFYDESGGFISGIPFSASEFRAMTIPDNAVAAGLNYTTNNEALKYASGQGLSLREVGRLSLAEN